MAAGVGDPHGSISSVLERRVNLTAKAAAKVDILLKKATRRIAASITAATVIGIEICKFEVNHAWTQDEHREMQDRRYHMSYLCG